METLFTGHTAVDPAASPSRLTLSSASLGTITDLETSAPDIQSNGAHAEPAPEVLNSESIDLEVVPESEPPSSSTARPKPHDADPLTSLRASAADGAQDITDRVDKWFRTEKARIESARGADDDSAARLGASLATDLSHKTGSETTTPDGQPTWDDSENMDRLLADVERTLEEQDRAEALADADESDSDEEETRPFRRQPIEPPPVVFIPPGGIPRRKRSAARMVAGIVASGVVGLSLGYYALIWIAGSTGDFLNVAQHLPSAMLPAEMRSAIVVDTDADDRGAIHTGYSESVSQEDTLKSSETGEGVVATDVSTTSSEPQPFNADVAQPLDNLPVKPAGRLVSPPSFSPNDFAVALLTAEEAQPNLVNGDLDDGREVQRAKGLSYSLLCDLAQKSAFVDATTRVAYVKALSRKAEELFRKTLADAHTRAEVAVIVQKWIASPHRKHGGVFFGGTVTQDVDKGSVVECQVDIGDGQAMTVLVPPAAGKQLSESPQPLGVIGWIVDNPATQVGGYTGEARRAIWAAHLIPLQ